MLTILTYPNELLRTKAEPVDEIDDSIKKLIDEMAETMYAAPGVGLSANQVGVLKRIAVIDTEYSEGKPNLIVLVNPEIIDRQGTSVREEGCLSFPGIHEDLTRAERVTVRALNREGKPFEITADGLLGVALQHEIDHLDGMLLVDHVSFLKKRIITRQLQKAKKAGKNA